MPSYPLQWLSFYVRRLLLLKMPFQTQKMLSYEDYFENEHGFYLDTITKSKQYLNMSTGLFSPLVQKEANGTITRNGQEVTGIIGNSEIVFSQSIIRFTDIM